MPAVVKRAPGGRLRQLGASDRRVLRNAELAVLGLLVAVPLLSRDAFFVDRIGRFLLLAVFAISVDLIWGYGGMFTFGQAAFFGGAGYVVGMLTTREGWILPVPLWISLVAAVLFSSLLALAISYFTFTGRGALRGVEFAVVTLAVSVALERLANAGGSTTGGQNGILIAAGLGPFDRGTGFYLLAGLSWLGPTWASGASSGPGRDWSFAESARTRRGSSCSVTTSPGSSDGRSPSPAPSPGWRVGCSTCTKGSSHRRRWESELRRWSCCGWSWEAGAP